MVDPLAVGQEVKDAANRLVHRLVTEKVEEKCRLFAVAGMGGIGKTTLAQKIYNHEIIKVNFNLKIWVCVSHIYSEIELLQRIIREANGSYGNANTISELLPILSDSVASGHSLFLVLDDVWRADLWVDLLRVPLYNANTIVRVLVTTRYDNVAKGMDVAPAIHHVEQLSTESCWDMLRMSVFHHGEEEQANELKNLGFEIVKKCGHLPLAIKAIASVLKKEITKKAWLNILNNKAGSISKLPEELRGALYLSFEDLPSHLKQCFLYFSLYPEDARLSRYEVTRFWVAEGFITEEGENLMLEDVAEKYFNELLERNLLQPWDLTLPITECKMHDLNRSLALFLSNKESSFVNENVKNVARSSKLRRLSVGHKSVPSAQILDLIADPGGLRTLFAPCSGLLLDHESLMQFSRLRLLDISRTGIEILPDSIGSLVHLRYLNFSYTNITTIPESIEHLAYLQFLIIKHCKNLTQLPRGVIQLGNLRCLELKGTPLSFIPKGIGKLKHLNELIDFVVDNNDSSSQLEELNSLNQIRKLGIKRLERATSGAKILEELSYLSDLRLDFTENISERNVEEQLAAEKLFDELTPPPNLEELRVSHFFGNRFPYWMALSTFERCVPHLTELRLDGIKCTQLPPLGQMLELKFLYIRHVDKVKKIGPEFLGGGAISPVNSSIRIAFPKLQVLHIYNIPELEEWSFGAEVEENASPRLKLMPCLNELYIYVCPLLKQLPKGLRHSAMKLLHICEARSLESLDDLPAETEQLHISISEKLETVCSLPALKSFTVTSCDSLSCMGNLDSLQRLEYDDTNKQSLPEWLLMLLQRQGLKNESNETFNLELLCSNEVLQECLEGGSYWDLIRHIPQVTAYGLEKGYLRYNKRPYFYETKISD